MGELASAVGQGLVALLLLWLGVLAAGALFILTWAILTVVVEMAKVIGG